MNKSQKFRKLLESEDVVELIGAHNGLSAKLGEEAGFHGIWASGFEISASFAVPDANILTMTENLEVAKAINNAVNIPVVCDCDNGFGNAINTIRMVEEYENSGIAGVCIEDAVFPKRCSFYETVKREMAPVEEHVGKIIASKNAQRNMDFFVIARTEAFIAGWDLEEVLKRTRNYADAGADAVLVHSKSKTSDEIKKFMEKWNRETPVVVVPTIYKDTSTNDLKKMGVKIVIFANHGLRASIKAMRNVFSTLKKTGTPSSVDSSIVELKEVYGLVGLEKMSLQEKLYLSARKTNAIILAAGKPIYLEELTKEIPKGMLNVKGKSIIERQIDILNSFGINNVSIVRGYKKEANNFPNTKLYDNEEYSDTGIAFSLSLAKNELEDEAIVSFSDIIFEREILEKLLESKADIALAVDRAVNETVELSEGMDLVVTKEKPESSGKRFVSLEKENRIEKIGKGIKNPNGEFIGLLKMSKTGAQEIKKAVLAFKNDRKTSLNNLIQWIIDKNNIEVKAVNIYKGWVDVDTLKDYKKAWQQA